MLRAKEIIESLPKDVSLVAVTKTRPNEVITKLYDLGIRTMGENRVQELLDKYEQLPKDIHWHLIGHLQRNKVKYIAPFVSMIHSVDSLRLAKEIHKEAIKNDRCIPILLQLKVAKEDSKFGISPKDIDELIPELLNESYTGIQIRGIMGMATLSHDHNQIHEEFKELKKLYDYIKDTYFLDEATFDTLSMGMSSDYSIAIEEGSNMVRIGSALYR